MNTIHLSENSSPNIHKTVNCLSISESIHGRKHINASESPFAMDSIDSLAPIVDNSGRSSYVGG